MCKIQIHKLTKLYVWWSRKTLDMVKILLSRTKVLPLFYLMRNTQLKVIVLLLLSKPQYIHHLRHCTSTVTTHKHNMNNS